MSEDLRAESLAPHRRLGDFELTREIGRGGMGVVYLADQVSLRRKVALKVLPPGLGLTPQAIVRFEREARAAARLHHTNIVPVYAIGEADGCHFYAMELVDGQPLSKILDDLRGDGANPLFESTVTLIAEQGRQKPREAAASGVSLTPSDTSTGSRAWFDAAAKLLADVAEALHYAHGQGIVHRDVKPSNLLLSRESRLCVTDFGLARMAQEPGMTVSGSFLGTPAYMSPEQIAAGRVTIDHRTDIYSLGAVLYEVLTLQRPFPGETREEVLTGILTKEPRGPRRVNPRVPSDLETICLKAMEKDPDRRYRSAADMAADLRSYLQRGLIAARRAGPWRRAGRQVRRHPVAAVATGAAVLLLGVGGLAWQARAQRAEEAARRAVADSLYDMSQGRYREGLRRIDSALKLNPEMADARLIRARLLINVGGAREAAEEAEALLKEKPDEWTAHLVLAAAARGFGGVRPGTSIEHHIKVVEEHAPETAEAYYLRSLVAESEMKAVEYLDRVLSLDPGHAEALLERSRRLNSLHRFQEALADCDRLIAARPRSAQARRAKSQVHSHQGDDDKALNEINRALELDPEEMGSLLKRGNLHLHKSRTQEAIADFSNAIDLDPEDGWARFWRAEAYYAQGRQSDALADLTKAIDLSPEAVDMYTNLAWLHRRRGEMGEARAVLERLEKSSANWTDPRARAQAHLALAEAAKELGGYERSLSEADLAMSLDPDMWEVPLLRASVKRLLGDEKGSETDCASAARIPVEEFHEIQSRAWELHLVCDLPGAAIADFTRLIEFDPAWLGVYDLRAAVYRQLGRFQESLADETKCMELAPSQIRCQIGRGQTYFQMDQFDRALADFDKVAQLEPENPWIHPWRGGALLRLGRTAEALQAYDKAVSLAPHTVQSRSLAYATLGRLDEALADLDRFIELMPSSPEGYLQRAYLLTFKPGSCDRTVADLRKARELVPPDAWDASACRMLSMAHLAGLFYACPREYDSREALSFARKAAALQPSDPEARWVLGAALHRNGRYKEAVKALEAALPAEGEESGELFFLAMASHRLGRSREARAYYERALVVMKDTPHDPEILRFRDEAARLLGVPVRPARRQR